MNFKKLLLLLPLLILFSCTVQKRHYQKGYFISWKHKRSETPVAKEKTPVKSIPSNQENLSKGNESVNSSELNATASNALNFVDSERKPCILSTHEDSCDVLVYKDGSEIRVKLSEVSSAQLKYKRCDMPDGPSYITNKTDLFMIKYANGTKEVVKVAEPAYKPAPATTNGGTRQRYVKKNTKLATVGLVFGILGFYPLVIVGGIIAVITGYIQLTRVRMNPDLYGAEKKAIVDIALGIASIALWCFIIALAILV